MVNDTRALEDFSVRPRGVKDAIARSLDNEDNQFAQTRWSDALSSGGPARTWGGIRFGQRIVDSRSIEVPVSVALAFAPIQRIGGKTGWYYGNWLWRIRAYLDMLLVGVGMRRGRPHPTELHPGDALDFWRVEAIDAPDMLRLKAEMKLPGRAWLQFELRPGKGEGFSTIRQTAMFDPAGLFGRLYWYALWPIHQLVFGGMLKRIAQAADRPIDGTIS